MPHDYLETLEGASKDDRVVVLFDPIGTGNSTSLPADARSGASGILGTQGLVAQVIQKHNTSRRVCVCTTVFCLIWKLMI